ncbi:hypothetical protein EHO60_01980 [Leptospira fletcheri]|uniref:DUF2269 family protein n=1 Tax=Leptospira fletcheri TaxID=2484981 RepID=A0A4R9GKC2_9LEPT|nr:hypothetical protein [Leptospira fletcheri]TGK14137.1 hypothetical protein EHO60_01980 [Leptospira fletcheri]
MSPSLRKFNLTTHVAVSVGWMGAVVSFLVLSIAGIASANAEVVRSSYISMDLVSKYAILPMSLASVLTGLILAFGTPWGLFRYYWVFIKFLLGVFATIALILHQFVAISEASKGVMIATAGSFPNPGKLGPQLVLDAALAFFVLFFATLLSVYKPWGMISKAPSKAETDGVSSRNIENPRFSNLKLKILLGSIAIAIILFAIFHISKNGFGNHIPSGI